MKKQTASDNLLSQLGKSLQSEQPKPIASAPEITTKTEARKTLAKTELSEKPAKKVKATNRNVSLYPENEDIIYEIQTLIRKHTGKKCSDSRAIQLALKLFPLSNVQLCVSGFEEVSKNDGRSS